MDGGVGASIGVVLQFLFMLFAGPVFSTIGGLLGAAIFRKPMSPLVPGVHRCDATTACRVERSPSAMGAASAGRGAARPGPTAGFYVILPQ